MEQALPPSTEVDWASLFGPSVMSKDVNLVDVAPLLKSKKYLGVYFSAHWCPPCRAFTPALTAFYNQMKQRSPGEFEVLFVSFDHEQTAFRSYWDSMPWPAMPFQAAEGKRLSNAWGVQGIPSLVILETATGRIVNYNAKSAVDSDPSGAQFPWATDNKPSAGGNILHRLFSPLGLLIIFAIYMIFFRSS